MALSLLLNSWRVRLCAGILVLWQLPAAAQPTVTTLTPARNRQAARNADVGVTFSAGLNARTLRALRIYSAQAGGKKAGAASLNGRTLTFNPAADFKAGETLWATLDTAARDSLRQPLARPLVWQFRAAATGGTGMFSGGTVLNVPNGAFTLLTGDIDNDGDLDLLSTRAWNGAGLLALRLNDGTGSFYSVADAPLTYAGEVAALGDVDGDGSLDLVTVGQGRYAVYRNNGRGSFSSLFSRAISGSIYGNLCLADLDGDGDLDLVFSDNSNNGTVLTYLNNGAGTFASGSSLTLPNQRGKPLAVGDVDSDGDVDLLVVSSSNSSFTNRVTVQLNNGRGGFTAGTTATVGTMAQRVRLADVDNDGDLDLVTLNIDDKTPAYSASVCLNTGAGTFGAPSTVPVGSQAQDLSLADVEGDGDVDLLVVNRKSQDVSVRLNNGSGGFTVGTDVTVGADPTLLATPDVDGDGDVDLVTSHWASGNLTVLRNGGNSPAPYALTAALPAGNAQQAARTASVQASFSVPMSGAAGSLGALRVFSASNKGRVPGTVAAAGNTLAFTPAAAFRAGEQLTVTVSKEARNSAGVPLALPYVWQFTAATTGGNGQFSGGSDMAFPLPTDGPSCMRLGDVDGDGDLDLVTSFNKNISPPLPSPVTVRLNDGAGAFGAPTPLLGPTTVASDFRLGDIDGDGDLDFVGHWFADRTPTIWLNNGTGTFVPGGSVSYYNGGLPTLGDVDGDGDLDLLDTGVRLNDGQGNFTGSAQIAAYIARGGTLADLNGDGDLDYVLSSDGTNDVLVSTNDGTGSFAAAQQLYGYSGASNAVLTPDVDGDGDADVLANRRLWFNDGSGTLSLWPDFLPLISVQAAGDVDGDGDMDLVGAGNDGGRNGVRVCWNDGRGNFSSGPFAPVTSGLISNFSVLGDIDNDGDLDLVSATDAERGASGGGLWLVRFNNGTVTAAAGPARPRPEVQVWPNPAAAGAAWQVQLAAPAGAGTLTVRNMVGQVVRRLPLTGPRTLVATEGLPAGVYQLSVELPNASASLHRVIVY